MSRLTVPAIVWLACRLAAAADLPAPDALTTAPSPPQKQRAIALNGEVRLGWEPVIDPSGLFDHYAVYRADQAFSSVVGMTPIATLAGIETDSHVDTTALNGRYCQILWIVRNQAASFLSPSTN